MPCVAPAAVHCADAVVKDVVVQGVPVVAAEPAGVASVVAIAAAVEAGVAHCSGGFAPLLIRCRRLHPPTHYDLTPCQS